MHEVTQVLNHLNDLCLGGNVVELNVLSFDKVWQLLVWSLPAGSSLCLENLLVFEIIFPSSLSIFNPAWFTSIYCCSSYPLSISLSITHTLTSSSRCVCPPPFLMFNSPIDYKNAVGIFCVNTFHSCLSPKMSAYMFGLFSTGSWEKLSDSFWKNKNIY